MDMTRGCASFRQQHGFDCVPKSELARHALMLGAQVQATENFEVNTGVIVSAPKTHFAPAKVNLDPDEAWSPQDSANFRTNHIDSLDAGYKAVADAGGYYELKN